MKEQLSELAKDIIADCEKDKLSIYETCAYVNKLCKTNYSMKKIVKYMRRVAKQRQRTDIVVKLRAVKENPSNLPYVPIYLPHPSFNETRQDIKEERRDEDENADYRGFF